MATNYINRENRTIANFLRDARKYPVLTKDEEFTLVRIAQSSDPGAKAAKDRLINCNLRYIISKAHNLECSHAELMDLVQEGIFGLIDAIEHFDSSKEVRFLTYATHWIEKRMKEYISSFGQCVILPDDGMKVRSKVAKVRRQLLADNGYEPSLEEIAEVLGMKASRIEAILNCGDNQSFDSPLAGDNDDDRTLRDKFVDEECKTPDQLAHESTLASCIKRLLNHLTGKERIVIELQYGLGNGTSLSLREIAVRLGIAHETVRKTSIKAHTRLKGLMPVLAR